MRIRYIKSWSAVIVAFLTFSIFPIHAYATTEGPMGKAKLIEGAKQYSDSREARVIGSPRGRLISSAEITMTNKGGGTIGVYSDILCHEAMKEIRMWLILERWIPEEEVWESIQIDKFSWNADDFPQQELTKAIVSYNISKLERGRDYRISGLFGADALTSGLSETWSVDTPNFFLE